MDSFKDFSLDFIFMKNGVNVPFAYFPSLRRVLLDGIEDKTASYALEEDSRIDKLEELEAELLDRCSSCYAHIKRMFKVMKTHNNSVPSGALVELIGAKQEHLKKRAGFEGLLLSQCTFGRGQEYGELGRMYLGRCHGSMKFHCSQEIAVGYVDGLNELIQIEAP